MSLAADKSEPRLAIGIVISLAVNAIVWAAASGIVNRHVKAVSPRLTFERVVIDKKTGVKRPVPKKPKPIVHKLLKPPPPQPPRPAEPTHNQVVTAAPSPNAPKTDFHAPAGGAAPLGKPVETQGSALVAPPPSAPVVTEKPAPPAPPASVVTEKPPAPVDAPKTAPPPPPPPVEKPKPVGPTRDAEPANTVSPEIPENLKSDSLKAFVRVKVHIQPDGSFEVILRTSSNNSEVDRLVLDALKKWKWKPALLEGEPVESTKLFKFEFEVK